MWQLPLRQSCMILKEQDHPQRTRRKTEVPAGAPTPVSLELTVCTPRSALEGWLAEAAWRLAHPLSVPREENCTDTASRNFMSRSSFKLLRFSEGNKDCLRNHIGETGDTNVLCGGKACAGRCWLRIQHKTTLLGTGGLEYATVNRWSEFCFYFLIYPLSSAFLMPVHSRVAVGAIIPTV